MSALARILRRRGARVGGSDRSFDRGETPEKFSALIAEGIELYPQDGSGPVEGYEALVVSSAVEETIPDVQAARRSGVPVFRRAEVLSSLFNASRGIAIGGTSGKTTTCGMAGWIFHACGRDPVIVNGGIMHNFSDNAVAGNGEWFIAETDESDGSIDLFNPLISVLTNMTLDHKPLHVLRPMFQAFLRRAGRGAVVNLDDPESVELLGDGVPEPLTFSLKNPAADLYAEDIRPEDSGVSFRVQNVPFHLRTPGRHNVSNALAAIGGAYKAGISIEESARALESFKGIARRMDVLGLSGGVSVFDDFAHNPDKIAASLQVLHEKPGRVIVIFQLHGFGPARLLREALVQTFCEGLGASDILVMPEIFYAGGTVEASISARDIVEDIRVRREGARGAEPETSIFFNARAEIPGWLKTTIVPGDRIVVMGARDDTLTGFGHDILHMFQ